MDSGELPQKRVRAVPVYRNKLIGVFTHRYLQLDHKLGEHHVGQFRLLEVMADPFLDLGA